MDKCNAATQRSMNVTSVVRDKVSAFTSSTGDIWEIGMAL